MNIIHGMKTLPRLVGATLAERLRVMPAVVLTGARQTGKSTLAEHLVQGERRYRSLDDFDVLDAARRAPGCAGCAMVESAVKNEPMPRIRTAGAIAR